MLTKSDFNSTPCMCTKGALKHKFPLKNLELCTHTFGNFFFNMREDFFALHSYLSLIKRKICIGQ